MESTFISIHDLTPEARVLYSSDSVIDILGYTPDEIVNTSAWSYFHDDELPYAKEFHKKQVTMDKAAVLAYCRVKNREGQWIGCECCFTIVYDVMIVCTSIYQHGGKAEGKFRGETLSTAPLTDALRPSTCGARSAADLLIFAERPTLPHA